MSSDWLNTFPTEENKPEKFYPYCPRLDKNILIDRFGNCCEKPKYEICHGFSLAVGRRLYNRKFCVACGETVVSEKQDLKLLRRCK